MLRQRPAVHRGKLACFDKTKVRGAGIYPFANTVEPPEIISKPIEVVDNPVVLYRETRIVAAPEERALAHLDVALAPEVECVLVRRVAGEPAVVMDHRQADARSKVHHLCGSPLFVFLGLYGLKRRQSLSGRKRASGGVHSDALGLEEGDTACVRDRLATATGFR